MISFSGAFELFLYQAWLALADRLTVVEWSGGFSSRYGVAGSKKNKKKKQLASERGQSSLDRLEFSPTQVNKSTKRLLMRGDPLVGAFNPPTYSLYCRPSVPRISIIQVGKWGRGEIE